MTKNRFNVTDRVELLPDARRGYGADAGARATVTKCDAQYVWVKWDNGGKRYGQSDGNYPVGDFKLVEPASTYLNGIGIYFMHPPLETPFMSLLKKQERFVTAYKDGPDFALTGDNAFNTQRDADNHANELAATNADVTVVVLKVVSQHSSRIVVTTEHAA